MRTFLLSLVATLLVAAPPAVAQTEAEVDARIDSVLGDHAAYREVFDALQAAVADRDAEAVAELIDYPIAVPVDGEVTTIDDAAEFAEQAESIFTPEIEQAIAGQDWQDVFVNAQGVMLGNGQVWLNGVCRDEACVAFDVKVITIQSTSN